jgi:dihydroneopterin aldolase
MSDVIKIAGIEAKGFHGVLEKERKRGQKFLVDVELYLPIKNLNDQLSRTVNYAEVAQVVNNEITGEPRQLIESLAEDIAKQILKEFKKIKKVKVTVHKPHAPIPLKFKDVSVEIERSR